MVAIVLLAIRSNRGRTELATYPLPGSIGSETGDRATLDQLQKAGGDLSKPTEVLFYLSFETRGLAEKAAERGGTARLPATVEQAASGQSWLCLFKGQMVPELGTIHGHALRLSEIAESLGGQYDGWEAAVTR
jgi:hypothetical protein